MQIVRVETLISKGDYPSTDEWRTIRDQAQTAVRGAVWPLGSDKFTIYPESGKKTGMGNGVTPIKLGVIEALTRIIHGTVWKCW